MALNSLWLIVGMFIVKNVLMKVMIIYKVLSKSFGKLSHEIVSSKKEEINRKLVSLYFLMEWFQ